ATDERTLGGSALAVGDGPDQRSRARPAADDRGVLLGAAASQDTEAVGGDAVDAAVDLDGVERDGQVRAALDLAGALRGNHSPPKLAAGGNEDAAGGG